MSLPLPNLDDRTFDQLVEEARLRMQRACPEWTDQSPSEPGMVLLDAFAYLTETLLYRLNKLPEKAYIAFLNLIDVRLQPPAAAAVELVFTSPQPVAAAVELRAGTRVATGRAGPGGEPVVFTTDESVRIEAGQTTARVTAHHCELVEAELAGVGSGLPGASLRLKRPPVIAATLSTLDLLVGVETDAAAIVDRAPTRLLGDKTFRIWSEVDSFVTEGRDPFVFVADRMAGLIGFAPALRALASGDDGAAGLGPVQALAAVPPAGKEIRVWYRRGGGAAGNVAAGALDTLKDPLPGVSLTVSNPERAAGGRDAESLDNALGRGPIELHSLRRAVTARDFEGLALRNAGGVARAKVFTQRALWQHAIPGTVDVVLVPNVDRAARGACHEQLDRRLLEAHQSEPERLKVSRLLDERRPLGTNCVVRWARYQPISVAVEIVLHRVEDPEAVCARIEQRLYQALSPLPSERSEGWRFGDALVKSRIYEVVNAEPGIRYVKSVRLAVAAAPSAVKCLAADRFQPRAWYAGGEAVLFRSTNDGNSWEPIREFAGEVANAVAVHWDQPGCLAVATRRKDKESDSRVYVSQDCGESWQAIAHGFAAVTGLAWTSRDRAPLLLIATRTGLYELAPRADASPLLLTVFKAKPNLGFTAIVSEPDPRGAGIVAVAAESATEGVFVSVAGGRTGSFSHIGLVDAIRALRIQRTEAASYVWAALAAAGDEDGRGCQRWEVREGAPTPDQRWEPFASGWAGGSAIDVACSGSTVYAATHRRGVLALDTSADQPAWQKPDIRCGLPLRRADGDQIFQLVNAVAAAPGDGDTVMAAGDEGVFRRDGERYLAVAQASGDVISLPEDWLLCSGRHQVRSVLA